MLFNKYLQQACGWLFAIALSAASSAHAGSFSVSPIRADLKSGVLSETITVTNEAPTRLRVLVKLVEWTQDANGNDVYTDSSDLVYFPRQMDIEPGAKRLVRVGAKAPAQGAERAYRLFIEEVPAPSAGPVTAVNFYFRFGVPVFVTPATAAPQPEFQATLAAGKLALQVRNTGRQHFRASRVTFSDQAGWTREVTGWYSLASTSRSYQAEVPPEICRKAQRFGIVLEADDGRKFDHVVDADPASCS